MVVFRDQTLIWFERDDDRRLLLNMHMLSASDRPRTSLVNNESRSSNCPQQQRERPLASTRTVRGRSCCPLCASSRVVDEQSRRPPLRGGWRREQSSESVHGAARCSTVGRNGGTPSTGCHIPPPGIRIRPRCEVHAGRGWGVRWRPSSDIPPCWQEPRTCQGDAFPIIRLPCCRARSSRPRAAQRNIQSRQS
jgi:hypothetical protein